MCHDLVWYQNACDNYYITHVHHVFFCVDQETEIQETGLSHNTSSRLDYWNIYYFARDTLCLSNYFTWPFFVFYWYKIIFLHDALEKCFWNYYAKLTSVFCVAVWTVICISKRSLPGSWKLSIRWNMNLLSVTFRPSITSLPCTCALINYIKQLR